MSIQDSFKILGIQETLDKDAIRNAYRALLADNNPEENPDGFKRLRTAYEVALAAAEKGVLSDDEGINSDRREIISENTVYGVQVSSNVLSMMKELNAITFSRKRRLDIDEWKRLLSLDVFEDLEDGQVACSMFFRYLSEHFHHKAQVYQVINDAFDVVKRQDEFKEFMPGEFVDFMVSRIADIEGSGDFPFELLTGRDDVDVDGFIIEQMNLERCVRQNDYDGASDIVDSMKKYGLSHPFYEAESALVKVHKGDKEEACDTARRLIAEYGTWSRILVSCGNVLWEAGFCDEAVAAYRGIESNNIYADVERNMAEYEYQHENYADAIKHCDRISDFVYDEKIDIMAKKILDTVYEKYTKRSDLNDRETETLMAAFLELEKNKEGLVFARKNAARLDEKAYYHRFLGRYCFWLDMFDEAQAECIKWRDILQKESPDDNDLMARTYFYEAQIARKQAEKLPKGKKNEDIITKYYEEAYENALKATKLWARPVYKNFCIDVLMKLKRYQQAEKMANECLENNPYDYGMMIFLEEIYYHLDRPQEVVNTYINLKNAGVAVDRVFEFAAKVFVDYGQYNDAMSVYDAAKEAGIESVELTLVRLSCMGRNDDAHKIIDVARNIIHDLEIQREKDKESVPSELIAAAYFEMSRIADVSGAPFAHPNEKTDMLKKAIKYDSSNPNYLYMCGRFCMLDGNYHEAIKWLQKGAINCEGHFRASNIYEHLGYCYFQVDANQLAIDAYKKIIDIDPEHNSVYGRIGEVYRDWLLKRDNIMYVKPAIEYLSEQIKRTPDNWGYIMDRFDVYLRSGDYQNALIDADRVLELRPMETDALYNKGRALMGLKRYQDALDILKKAAQIMEGTQMNLRVYKEAGRCCRMLRDYKQAEKWYIKGKNYDTRGTEFIECLLYVYEESHQWDKAKAQCSLLPGFDYAIEKMAIDLIIETDEEKKKNILNKIKNEIDSVINGDKKLSNKDMEDIAKWSWYLFDDFETAAEFYEKAIKNHYERDNCVSVAVNLMFMYYLLDNKQKIKETAGYVERYLKKTYYYNKELSPEEQFANDLWNGMVNRYNMALYHLFLGDFEKAEEYAKMMAQGCLCQHCKYPECCDYYEVLGLIDYCMNKPGKGREFFEKSLNINPANEFSGWMANRLKIKEMRNI